MQPLHSRGSPNKGTKSEVATSPLPSQGPTRGRKCCITPAFSGIPNKGEQNQKWLPHPCLLKGPQEGGSATSPLPSQGPTRGRKCCITPAFSGIPNKGEQNQKWLPHPCLLKGPQEGGSATSPLPSRGTESEVAASPLPSRGPTRGRKCYVTPAFLGVPKQGDKITSGWQHNTHTSASSSASSCVVAELLWSVQT